MKLALEVSVCNRKFSQVLVLGWLDLIWICEAALLVWDMFKRRRVWYHNCYFLGGWKDHLHLLDFSILVCYKAWLHLVFAYICRTVLCHLGRCRGFVASHSFAALRWICKYELNTHRLRSYWAPHSWLVYTGQFGTMNTYLFKFYNN